MTLDGRAHEAVGEAISGAASFRACYVVGGAHRVIRLGRGRDREIVVGEHASFEAACAMAQRLTRRSRGRAALEALRKLGAIA